MKVKLKIQISGTRDGVEWPAAGETLDVSADEAKVLISSGIAVEVAEEPKPSKPAKVETATVSAPETAAVKNSPKGK